MSIMTTDALHGLGLRSTVRRLFTRTVVTRQWPVPREAPPVDRAERAMRNQAAERRRRQHWDRHHTDPLINRI